MGMEILILIAIVVACVAHRLERKVHLPRLVRPSSYVLTSLIAGFSSSLVFVVLAGLAQGYISSFWPLMLVIGTWWGTLIAILVGIFFQRAPKPQAGHCATCDYNLTGNVSGVCPECGRRIAGE